ncbi:FAD-dependent monooxygenase [Amycolatopsis anabasis]|uniref:FAD-dependent monooxygenase n=1 Tax=Amycolatopsis anabasis TaxID=1840409 RepID=UPI00131C9FB2|nr:FAD-dependent monooxygenase [Amycolatopsis anabasis]
MDTTEVLVVGAGPTGLTLACALLRQEVPVRVVDQAPGPAATSRANILHARGVEVLDRLGALGDLPERAVTALTITAYAGGRPVSSLRFGDVGLGTARPALLVSQADIEAELRRVLAELGGAVEWNTALTGVELDDTGVTAALGTGKSVRASWLVGCDGAHSATRKLAGIGFPGAPIADRWLLADVRLDWPLDRSGSHGWLHRDGVFGALPMRMVGGADDVWRLMAYVPDAGAEKLGEDQVLEWFHRLLPERTGVTDFRIRGAVWTSVFRIHRRLAERYRRGRVLLAGDAAHIHSPLGGQGMLTGIGDAENLAWKLALVTENRATEALLDTYQAERRPLAVNVLRRTSANTRFQVGTGPVTRFLRERVVTPLLDRPVAQRWATAAAAQLWVSYRRGPLAEPTSRFARRPRPGDRVPDLPCRRANGDTTRLHAELGDRWALLSSATVETPLALARERLGERIDNFTLADVRPGEVWLVRPDAHLAWRGAPEAGGLARWLDHALRTGRVR